MIERLARASSSGMALAWGFTIGLLLPFVLAAIMSGCSHRPISPRGAWDRDAYAKCGPEGYHDWDDRGPVCEREGWNGREYPEQDQ